MDVNALRTWGIVVSAALMAAALAISLQPPRSRPAAAQAVVGAAQRQGASAAPVEFIVRFRGSGPIARAQARASRDPARAQREVEAQLRRQSGFAGLCFDRFTAGASEVVLRTCADVPAPAQAAVQRAWLTRLRAMQAVAYADANLAASAN